MALIKRMNPSTLIGMLDSVLLLATVLFFYRQSQASRTAGEFLQ